MKKRLVVTEAAREQFKQIARDGNREWGRRPTQAYISELREQFRAFRDYPNMGTSRDDIRPGYRLFPQGSHIIYYRVQDDRIEIIAVLHKSMDVENRL